MASRRWIRRWRLSLSGARDAQMSTITDVSPANSRMSAGSMAVDTPMSARRILGCRPGQWPSIRRCQPGEFSDVSQVNGRRYADVSPANSRMSARSMAVDTPMSARRILGCRPGQWPSIRRCQPGEFSDVSQVNGRRYARGNRYLRIVRSYYDCLRFFGQVRMGGGIDRSPRNDRVLRSILSLFRPILCWSLISMRSL